MSERPFPFLKFPRALPSEVRIPIRVVNFNEIHADFLGTGSSTSPPTSRFMAARNSATCAPVRTWSTTLTAITMTTTAEMGHAAA